MEYRKLPHGNEQISVLGFGTSSIGMAGEREIEAASAIFEFKINTVLAAGIYPGMDRQMSG